MGGVYRKKRGRVTTDTEMVIIKRNMYCADSIFNMDMYLVLFVLFSVVNDITSVKKPPSPFLSSPPLFLPQLLGIYRICIKFPPKSAPVIYSILEKNKNGTTASSTLTQNTCFRLLIKKKFWWPLILAHIYRCM